MTRKLLAGSALIQMLVLSMGHLAQAEDLPVLTTMPVSTAPMPPAGTETSTIMTSPTAPMPPAGIATSSTATPTPPMPTVTEFSWSCPVSSLSGTPLLPFMGWLDLENKALNDSTCIDSFYDMCWIILTGFVVESLPINPDRKIVVAQFYVYDSDGKRTVQDYDVYQWWATVNLTCYF